MTTMRNDGIPEAARKELYSVSYVTAVATSTQSEVLIPKMDYNSIDGFILATFGKCPQIGFQLKATSADCVQNDELSFDLPVKNYNDLRAERSVPSLLVVVHLPENEADWMTHQMDLLSLRNNAYYLNLLGMPDTTNTSTVRVKIPTVLRLTRGALLELLNHVADHKRLP